MAHGNDGPVETPEDGRRAVDGAVTVPTNIAQVLQILERVLR